MQAVCFNVLPVLSPGTGNVQTMQSLTMTASPQADHRSPVEPCGCTGSPACLECFPGSQTHCVIVKGKGALLQQCLQTWCKACHVYIWSGGGKMLAGGDRIARAKLGIVNNSRSKSAAWDLRISCSGSMPARSESCAASIPA